MTQPATKLKILVVSHGAEIGGIERSLIGLLDAIDYDACDVDLFLFRQGGEFTGLINEGAHVLPQNEILAHLKSPLGDVLRAGLWRLAALRIAVKVSARVARLRGRPASQFARLSRLSSRLVPDLPARYDVALGFQAPHDFLLEHTNAAVKAGWVHTDYSTLLPDAKYELPTWSRLDAIVAVSESARDAFLRVFPLLRDKALVAENVLDPAFVRRMAENSGEDLAPVAPGTVTLCTVGRYAHPKAFDVAIDACSLLVKSGLKVRWLAVGYGPERRALEEQVARLGLEENFLLMGSRANPYPYMREADIYVQPSRYEGKAVTVREAQILGKPVLITDFPTASSQLKDGVDGLICENSAVGVANGVKHLLSDPELRARLGRTASKTDYSNRAGVDEMFSHLQGLRSEA